MLKILSICLFIVLLVSAGTVGYGDSLGEPRNSSPLRNDDVSRCYDKIRMALKTNDKAAADAIQENLNFDDSIQVLLLSLMYRNAEVPLYLIRRREMIDQFGLVNVFLAVKTMRQLEFPVHLFTITEALEDERIEVEDVSDLIIIIDQFRYFIDPSKFPGLTVGDKLELARNRKVPKEDLLKFIRRSRLFIARILLEHQADKELLAKLGRVCGPAISELLGLIRTVLFIFAARSASEGDLTILSLDLIDPFESIIIQLLRRFMAQPF